MRHRFTSAKRGLALAVAALLASTALAACGSGSDSSGSGSGTDSGGSGAATGGATSAPTTDNAADSGPEGTYTLAFVGALSGPGAASGRVAADGLKAGVEYLNSLGTKVKYEYEERDSKGDPSTGANLARELAQSGVGSIYTSSTEIAAIQPVLNQFKVIGADSGGVTGLLPKLGVNKEYPWTFSTSTATGSLSIVPLLRFAESASGGAKVGQLADNGPYGTGQIAATEALAEAQFPDMEIVTEEFPATATSVTAQLGKLKDQGVNSIIVWTYGAPLIMVLQSLDRMGWYPYLATSLGVGDPSIVEATPEGLKGKIAGGGIASGQVEGSGKPAGELTPKFFELYSKIKGSTDFNALDTVASYTFDWAVAVHAAIQATGSLDNTEIRDWLISGEVIQGAQGPLKFGDEGEARIGISPDDATVFDPSQPCSDGLCKPVEVS